MAKNKPNQGSRKTETLTLRLDPKVKFTIDVISRVKRQSITGVVEAAVEALVFDLDVPFHDGGNTENCSVANAVTEVWSTDESERFVNFCYHLPNLLTFEEQRIWETIKASPVFMEKAPAKIGTHWQVEGVGRLNREYIRMFWSDLLEHVEENKESRTIVPFEPPF